MMSGGVYTGFALVDNTAYSVTLSVRNYTRLENLIVVCSGNSSAVALQGSARATGLIVSGGYWPDRPALYMGPDSLAQNCLAFGGGIRTGPQWDGSKKEVYNCTAVGGIYSGYRCGGGIFGNNLVVGSAGLVMDNGGNGSNIVTYCATENGTAGAYGGVGNRINQTFTFVDAANGDYHLALSDTGARGYGTAGLPCPLTTDIDGEPRAGAWDIGADQTPPANTPPTITSALTANGTVGQAFSYTITASGTTPITFGASGLPAGLSRSGATISGTPTTAGTNNITLTAVNAYGGATNTLALRILPVNPDANENGIPDTWEIQNFGSTNAINGGAQDDWDHDGMCNLAEYIAGTCPTNASSRFQVSGVRCQGTEFYLRFLTETGRVYGVVGKGELAATSQWVVVTNGMPGTGGYVEVRDPVTGAKKFYLVVVRLE
jgi:hypothetical protein